MNSTTFAYVADELALLANRLRLSTVTVKSGSSAVGSGVIWQSDGLIITNAHVLTSSQATVELSDGRIFPAVRSHFDPQQDLAALKIAATELIAAPVGDSEGLRVGELVVAVGNPFADHGAVTTGIIHSNNSRAVMADLRLYPGNSGGPLADCLGRVIGINTMIVNGLAVAVPSQAVNCLLSGHSLQRLGVTLQPVLIDRLTLGLLVLSILPNSVAETAGIKICDIFIGVSGQLFNEPGDLAIYLHHTEAHKSIPLDILRDGQQLVIEVVKKTVVEAT